MNSIVVKSSSLAISPQKLNLIAGLIRKKELDSSMQILSFLPKKGGRMVYKMLNSVAKDILQQKETLNNYYLIKVEVNRGKILKKIIFRAKGRSDRLRKRHSLINIYLSKKE
jgi:large subunit ribosomal protein L22